MLKLRSLARWPQNSTAHSVLAHETTSLTRYVINVEGTDMTPQQRLRNVTAGLFVASVGLAQQQVDLQASCAVWGTCGGNGWSWDSCGDTCAVAYGECEGWCHRAPDHFT